MKNRNSVIINVFVVDNDDDANFIALCVLLYINILCLLKRISIIIR
jgi:hypothetical protein